MTSLLTSLITLTIEKPVEQKAMSKRVPNKINIGLSGLGQSEGLTVAPEQLGPAPPQSGRYNDGGTVARGVSPKPHPQIHRRRSSLWRTGLRPSSAVEKKTASADKQEEVKAQLESITGRMFALLNDYEEEPGDGKSLCLDNLTEKASQMDNPALRDDIQLMLNDHNLACVERDELLYSLQDWFEEGHDIEDMLTEISDGQSSLSYDQDSLRKSLLESKLASERLRSVQEEIERGHRNGDSTNHLLQERQALEQELLKSRKVYDAVKGKKRNSGDNSEEVTHSWKFAAGEIFSVLTKVRNDGQIDVLQLEAQVEKLVDVIHAQSNTIDSLKNDMQQKIMVLEHEEFLRRKLQEESELLLEDIEELREQRDRYRKKLKSCEDQMNQMKVTKRATSLASERRSSMQSSQTKPKLLKGQIDAPNYQLAQLENRVKETEEENVKLQSERDALAEQVENLQKQLNEQTQLPKPDHVIGHVTGHVTNLPLKIAEDKQEVENAPSKPVFPPSTTLHSSFQSVSPSHQKSRRREEDSAQQYFEEDPILADKLEQLQEKHDKVVAGWEKDYFALEQVCDALQSKVSELENTIALKSGNREVCSDFPKPVDHQAISRIPVGGGLLESQVGGAEYQMEDQMGVAKKQMGIAAHYLSVAEEKVGVAEEKVGVAEDHTKVEGLQLVLNTLKELNSDKSEIENADSSTLQFVSDEMKTLCTTIQNFLSYSTNLINREAKIVSIATRSLEDKLFEVQESSAISSLDPLLTPPTTVNQFTSQKVPADEGNPLSGGSVLQDMNVRIHSIGRQAIRALKDSEKLFSERLKEKKKNFKSVVVAMAEHKKRQPDSFQFSTAKEEGLVLEAHALSSTAQEVKENRLTKRLNNVYGKDGWSRRMVHILRRRGMRMTRLPAILEGLQDSSSPATGLSHWGYSSRVDTRGGPRDTLGTMVIHGTNTKLKDTQGGLEGNTQIKPTKRGALYSKPKPAGATRTNAKTCKTDLPAITSSSPSPSMWPHPQQSKPVGDRAGASETAYMSLLQNTCSNKRTSDTSSFKLPSLRSSRD